MTGDDTIVWVEGDPWRDLTPAISAAEETTIITLNGTAHLIRYATRSRGAWHMRLPVEGGHPMWHDQHWRRLETLLALPCGILITEPDRGWNHSTPVRAVLEGLHPHWVSDPNFRHIATRVLHRDPVATPPGHPIERCPTRYCSIDQTHT